MCKYLRVTMAWTTKLSSHNINTILKPLSYLHFDV